MAVDESVGFAVWEFLAKLLVFRITQSPWRCSS